MKNPLRKLLWTDGPEYETLEQLRKELDDVNEVFGEQCEQDGKCRYLKIMAELFLSVGFMLSELKFFLIIFGAAAIAAFIF